jgi:hypothetical protein
MPGGHHARKGRTGQQSDRNAIQRDFRGDAIARLIDKTPVVTRTCIVDQQVDAAAREPLDDGARSVGGGQIGSGSVREVTALVAALMVNRRGSLDG